MPELRLKPTWPIDSFRRTIVLDRDKSGKAVKTKTLTFSKGESTFVTPAELKLLKDDLQKAVWEIEKDERGKVRYVESEDVPAAPVAKPDPAPQVKS